MDKPLSKIGKACFFEALRVLKRVYWNTEQQEWESWTDGTIGNVQWFASRDGEVEPNLIYKDVKFAWYKHPGRGMRVNKTMTPDEWASWLEDILEHLESQDVRI